MVIAWIEPVGRGVSNGADELLARARVAPRRAESAPLVDVREDDGGRDAASPDVQSAGLAQRLDATPQHLADGIVLRLRSRRHAMEREDEADAQRRTA